MKRNVFPKLLALLLIFCMVGPQVAMATVPAGSTCYIEVTIEDDKENLMVTDISSKYLTGESPLAIEVVSLIEKNYDELRIFKSPAMQDIMDEGLDAFATNNDTVWTTYLDKYFSKIDTTLKDLLSDKTVTLNAMEPEFAYKTSFKNEVAGDAKYGTTYTVTVILHINKNSGTGTGSGSGSGSTGCPYYTPCPSLPYNDLDTSKWYHKSVDYMLYNGIMIGTGTSTFTPYGTVTRGTLMTMLARLDGVDTTGSNPWYQIGMEWAVADGVSDGTNPQNVISREQIVTMLYRYAGSPTVSGDHLKDFPDADDVHSWAKDAVNWAVSAGIIEGTGEGLLNPLGDATRVELAAMFHRFCVNILKK